MEHQYVFYSRSGDSFNETFCDFAVAKIGTLLYKDGVMYRVEFIEILEDNVFIQCYPIAVNNIEDYDLNEEPIEELDPNEIDDFNVNENPNEPIIIDNECSNEDPQVHPCINYKV